MWGGLSQRDIKNTGTGQLEGPWKMLGDRTGAHSSTRNSQHNFKSRPGPTLCPYCRIKSEDDEVKKGAAVRWDATDAEQWGWRAVEVGRQRFVATSTVKLLKELEIHSQILRQTIKESSGIVELQPVVMDEEKRPQLGPESIGAPTQVRSSCGGSASTEGIVETKGRNSQRCQGAQVMKTGETFSWWLANQQRNKGPPRPVFVWKFEMFFFKSRGKMKSPHLNFGSVFFVNTRLNQTISGIPVSSGRCIASETRLTQRSHIHTYQISHTGGSKIPVWY